MVKRSRIAVSALALAIAWVPNARAEKPTKPQPPEAAAPAPRHGSDSSRRVPTHFAQVGLSTEQREAIYKVRAKHHSKIEALEKQIQELRALELVDCEAVLTEAQKQLLVQRRQTNGRGLTKPVVTSAKSSG